MKKLVSVMLALPAMGVVGCMAPVDGEGGSDSEVKAQQIVGGTPASDYRELARLDADGGTFCSGTLIAPRYVLTAGHCLSTYEEVSVEFPYADADGEVRSSVGIVTFYNKDLENLSQPDIGLVVLDSPVALDGGSYPYPVLNTTELGNDTDIVVTGMKQNDTDHGSGAYKSPVQSVETYDDNYYRHFGEISRRGDSGGGVFLAGSALPRTVVGAVQGRSDQNGDGARENFFQRVDAVINQINAQIDPPSCPGGNDEVRVELSRMMVHDGKEFGSAVLDVQVKITVDGAASGWSQSYDTNKGTLVGQTQLFQDDSNEMGIWGVTRKLPRDRCFPVKVEARERDSSFGNEYTQHHVSHETTYCYNAAEDAWTIEGTNHRGGTSRKSDGKFDVSMSWRAMRTQACTAGSSSSNAMGAYSKFISGNFDGVGTDEVLGYGSSWKTLFRFKDSNSDFEWAWSTYGDGHGLSPYEKLISGDFDGDGKDEILAFGSSWKTMFRYDEASSDFEWAWSTYGDGHGMSPYEDFIAGDFDGDGKDEILAFGSSWKTMFRYDAASNDFEWAWSTYDDGHGMSPYTRFVALDLDGDGADEVFAWGGWKTVFRYHAAQNDFEWVWSNYGNGSLGISPYQKFVAGDFDADGADELLAHGSSWKTMFHYDASNNEFDWGYSTYGSEQDAVTAYESFTPGRFRSEDRDGIIAKASWTTEFFFQDDEFHWGWSDYGVH